LSKINLKYLVGPTITKKNNLFRGNNILPSNSEGTSAECAKYWAAIDPLSIAGDAFPAAASAGASCALGEIFSSGDASSHTHIPVLLLTS
jgi:hypothetical protein